MNLYDRVKALCAENGMDVRALEYTLGYPEGTVKKWKKSLPSKWKLREVADVFRIRTEDLTDDKT